MAGPCALRVTLAALAVAATWTGPALATQRAGLEAMLGTAWNLPMTLEVRQEGGAWIRLRARYETRAFEFPVYYVARGLLVDDAGRGWSLDLVHHKIYLTNPPPEIGEFAISHGYNLLAVHRVGPYRPWHWGVGGGVVIAHPENTVRGLKLSEKRGLFRDGYYLAGTAASAIAGRRFALGSHAHLVAEARLAFAWARVPVVDGDAVAPHVGLHVTVGLGGFLPP